MVDLDNTIEDAQAAKKAIQPKVAPAEEERQKKFLKQLESRSAPQPEVTQEKIPEQTQEKILKQIQETILKQIQEKILKQLQDETQKKYFWTFFIVLILAAIIVAFSILEVLNYPLIPLSIRLFVIIALALIIPYSFDIFLAYQNKRDDNEPTGVEGLGRVLMTFGIILLVGAVAFYILTIVTENLRTLPTNFSSLDPKLIISNSSNTSSDKIIEIVSKNNDAIIDANKSFIDAIKTVLTTLGGAISAIIGFYFGQKAATESKKDDGDGTRQR